MAGTTVRASPADCLAVVGDVEGYPSWYPALIRRVQLIPPAHPGGPPVVQATLHGRLGPVERDFTLLLEVSRSQDGRMVRLSRLAHEDSDPERVELVWRIGDSDPAELSIEVSACLDVPRWLPLQGVGDTVAEGFLAAARQALEGAA